VPHNRQVRFAVGFVVLAGVVAAACGGGSSSQGSAAFDVDRALRDIQKLTESPREAGNNTAAAEYIAGEFAAARFGVLQTNFTFETDPNRPATVTLNDKQIEAITAGGSTTGEVTAPLAALPGAIVRDGLSGRIAVAQRGGASFQEKYDIAWASGAVGLVIVNSDAGSVTANLGETARFPVVTAAGSAQAEVDAALVAGGNATISVPAAKTASGTNITARSRSAHACTYIVVANFDAAPGSPGANDNASGVAVMLELARQFDARFPVPELCFVALDARFSGGQGVDRFLSALTQSGRPGAVISIAKLGAGKTLTMYGELTLKDRARAAATALHIDLADGGAAPPASTDGDSFRAAGISTIELSRPGTPIGRDDTFARIEKKRLAEAGRLVGELALAVSATAGP
jgi:aminopeptidase YwaD